MLFSPSFFWIPFLLLFRRHCDVALFNPSSFFVKILFNSFHLHSECCPNYIILFPSLSCLTGVSCPLLKLFSSYQVLHNFSTGVLLEFVLPCSSFLTECSQIRHLRCILSGNGLTFSRFFRFFGFTRLSKKQLSFTSSLSLLFSLRCHSRSRDEILS